MTQSGLVAEPPAAAFFDLRDAFSFDSTMTAIHEWRVAMAGCHQSRRHFTGQSLVYVAFLDPETLGAFGYI